MKNYNLPFTFVVVVVSLIINHSDALKGTQIPILLQSSSPVPPALWGHSMDVRPGPQPDDSLGSFFLFGGMSSASSNSLWEFKIKKISLTRIIGEWQLKTPGGLEGPSTARHASYAYYDDSEATVTFISHSGSDIYEHPFQWQVNLTSNNDNGQWTVLDSVFLPAHLGHTLKYYEPLNKTYFNGGMFAFGKNPPETSTLTYTFDGTSKNKY